MRRRKDMRGPGPLSIRCIFIIIAQLQHYLSVSDATMSAQISDQRQYVWEAQPAPPSPQSAPAIISGDIWVRVITNHDNHSDPWSRLITGVLSLLSLVQTPQCLLCPVWRGGLGDTCTQSY